MEMGENTVTSSVWGTFVVKVKDLFVAGYQLPETLHFSAIGTIQDELDTWKHKSSQNRLEFRTDLTDFEEPELSDTDTQGQTRTNESHDVDRRKVAKGDTPAELEDQTPAEDKKYVTSLEPRRSSRKRQRNVRLSGIYDSDDDKAASPLSLLKNSRSVKANKDNAKNDLPQEKRPKVKVEIVSPSKNFKLKSQKSRKVKPSKDSVKNASQQKTMKRHLKVDSDNVSPSKNLKHGSSFETVSSDKLKPVHLSEADQSKCGEELKQSAVDDLKHAKVSASDKSNTVGQSSALEDAIQPQAGQLGVSKEAKPSTNEQSSDSPQLDGFDAVNIKQEVEETAYKTEPEDTTNRPATHSSLDLTCGLCSKVFRARSSLLYHKKQKHDHPCPFCLYVTINDRELCTHIEKLHSHDTEALAHVNEIKEIKILKRNNSSQKGCFPCNLCNKIFLRKVNLQKHLKIHDSGYLQCPHCPKTFQSQIGFDTHINLHTGENTVKCDTCGAVFGSRSMRNAHVRRTHEKVKKHLCDICGRGFVLLAQLEKHRKITHFRVVDRHPCPHCPYKTHCPDSLKSHIKNIHVEPAPSFRCEICGLMLKYKHSLDDHRRRHFDHKGFQCSLCDFRGVCKKDVANHITRQHREAQEVCDICGKVFKQRGHLVRHRVIHTGEKQFACSLCSYCCNVKGNLRKHMITTHKVDARIRPAIAKIRSEDDDGDNGEDINNTAANNNSKNIPDNASTVNTQNVSDSSNSLLTSATKQLIDKHKALAITPVIQSDCSQSVAMVTTASTGTSESTSTLKSQPSHQHTVLGVGATLHVPATNHEIAIKEHGAGEGVVSLPPSQNTTLIQEGGQHYRVMQVAAPQPGPDDSTPGPTQSVIFCVDAMTTEHPETIAMETTQIVEVTTEEDVGSHYKAEPGVDFAETEVVTLEPIEVPVMSTDATELPVDQVYSWTA